MQKRFSEEFKIEAVRQITERGHKVADVAARLGISTWSLYQWRKQYAGDEGSRREAGEQAQEVRRLKAELRRVTEERDILKKAAGVLREAVPVKYAFVRDHTSVFQVRRMCAVLGIHPSGYYAWRRSPHSARALEDRRLVGLISQSWQDSGRVYGYRKVTHDLRDLGEICGRHRVARLMRENQLRSQTGYKRRPGHRGGRPSLVAENLLQQQFDVAAPDQAWVTDITYIRTHEGWLYLAVVLDLFARTVVGWSMSSRIDADLVLNALLAAVWRRRPKTEVIIHSDQGSQFGSHDWRDFLKAHRLKPSMSRRGNCHDNAVAESFFQLLKRERIRRRVYATREQARADIFDYIEMFYNPKRRHSHAGDCSPVEFENQHFLKTGTV
ncbi:IS3 family transposase [Castellaniella sp.]|uniref:IS3 family transposase n=1 Tax=Castellaniella sp. TaxID=1955812 RepID=UPI002AFE8EE2|nr:IS3 family transposase [Castellaniella sp.]